MGVLIVDDYGHWEGCRLAVDQYLMENRLPVLLQRIVYTGRIDVNSRCNDLRSRIGIDGNVGTRFEGRTGLASTRSRV